MAALIAIAGHLSAQTPSAPADTLVAQQLSKDDCLAFARSLETAMQQGDAKAFDQLVDWNAVVEAATASLGFSPQTRASFNRGVMQSFTSDKGFSAQIAGQMAADGSYRFIRVREKDGQKTILFRLRSDEGLNYHEWFLVNSGGTVKVADVYFYLSGERLSTTLRRSALPIAKQESKSWFEKMTTAESEYVKHIDRLGEMIDQLGQNRYDEALATYSRLPASLQRDKNVLLIRHQVASRTSDAELQKTIEDFRRYYPDDVCLDFLLIDYYTLRKQYDKALDSIDRLDASVGGDPHLNTLRADAVYQQGDTEKAFELVEKAIKAESDSVDPYWTFLGLAVLAKDHDRTRAGLVQIENRFHFDLSGIHDVAEYAEFLKSPQGQKWLQTHPKPPAVPAE